MTEKAPPHVAIVIVNYRGRDDTLECLQSLRGLANVDFTTIVVDQASDDGVSEAILSQFSEVVVVDSLVNDGFAGGCNRGAAHSVAVISEYVFFLNNDTIVDPQLLARLVGYAERHPDIGIVGPRMMYFDAPTVVWSDGGSISRRGDSGHVGQGRESGAEVNVTDDAFAVDFVVGCGMLVRRTLWDTLGPMDERYFLYYEEADFCAAARRAGVGRGYAAQRTAPSQDFTLDRRVVGSDIILYAPERATISGAQLKHRAGFGGFSVDS